MGLLAVASALIVIYRRMRSDREWIRKKIEKNDTLRIEKFLELEEKLSDHAKNINGQFAGHTNRLEIIEAELNDVYRILICNDEY